VDSGSDVFRTPSVGILYRVFEQIIIVNLPNSKNPCTLKISDKLMFRAAHYQPVSWIFNISLHVLVHWRESSCSEKYFLQVFLAPLGNRHGFTRAWEEEVLIDAARCSIDILDLLDVVTGLSSAFHYPRCADWDYF